MKKSSFPSPMRLVLLTVFAIYAAEGAIMLGLAWLPEISPVALAMIDASLIAVSVLPVLYFFLYAPMASHLAARTEAEEKAARLGRVFEETSNEIYFFSVDTLRFVQ